MIYIVMCGLYEDAENICVTQDINKAVTVALHHYRYQNGPEISPYWQVLNCIEVWNDGKKICEYGNMTHKISTHKPLTHDELKTDLIKAIKEAEDKE